MQIDAKNMRADLMPVTSAALDRFKLLLLNMARDATLVALEDVTARIQQLEARPTQLDDFVNYMVSLGYWRPACRRQPTAKCTCAAGCQHTLTTQPACPHSTAQCADPLCNLHRSCTNSSLRTASC